MLDHRDELLIGMMLRQRGYALSDVDVRLGIEYVRAGGNPRETWHYLISTWLNKMYNRSPGGDGNGRDTQATG